ncbi:GNAT family N-acetyltransferase [Agromyces archimandritae]|uniref:GNAT family N-acetyltransferase n=1 Tax=Agromyces archimandritae TaxID=2781962 RepID=A0A975FNS8_9MICO|nr:GNAT family N-acetyltransferase [Agromyces archimandritae]QTX05529.1 GNAT family N-acetyltransferase [Agromyces archimandritae]
MSTDVVADVIVRPIRDTDAEALGRVHASCWHETYDHLISAAAFERLSPRRMGELWNHLAERGEEYAQFAAVVGGEIVGFVGAGPARDEEPPRARELQFIYLLDAYHGTGIGQQLFDAACGDEPVYLWVAEDNPRAHGFYRRNGFAADGAAQTVPFLGEEIHEVRLVR